MPDTSTLPHTASDEGTAGVIRDMIVGGKPSSGGNILERDVCGCCGASKVVDSFGGREHFPEEAETCAKDKGA